jgi:ubiquinone/menaquinone biosynthesis C-methylase UbiE
MSSTTTTPSSPPATTSSNNPFVAETIQHYTGRAATYDNTTSGAGGWHAELGRDFVRWLPPPRGGAVLDLACGTGLVALPYAEAVGPGGVAVGVDVTEAMLEQARRKDREGRVTWVLGDITDLSSIDAVRQVVAERGGFDVISCCSALVLLEPPARRHVKHWTKYLKVGGKIIVDVTTEDRTTQYLFTVPLRRQTTADDEDKPFIFEREWIKGIHSVDRLYRDDGEPASTSPSLEPIQTFRTKSYTPEALYDGDQAAEVFEEKANSTYRWVKQDEATLNKARQIWPELWRQSLRPDGKFWDGHPLYVTIGRRRS